MDPDSRVLILSHFYARAESSGPPQDLRDFLLPKVKELVYIEHPFPFNARLGEDLRSTARFYKNGVLERELSFPAFKGPEVLFYIKDILATQWFLLKLGARFDLCVALDNLNTFSVMMWRKIRRIRKLVFYTIDYNPHRFKNRILNWVYHRIDRTCCYNADFIWNLDPRIDEGREVSGVDVIRSAPSIILPMGAHLSRIKRRPIDEIDRHAIAFVGYLIDRQGIQLVIKALKGISEIVKDVKFIIIGKGEYEQELKDLTKELGLEDHVDFKGFVTDHLEVENILTGCAIGVAPYMPKEDSHTFYTDPGKPKLYMGCGLPVVITRFPRIAHDIEASGAGIAIDYSEPDLKEALMKLLTDDAFYNTCRERAIEFSLGFDTEAILTRVLDETGAEKRSIMYVNYAPYGNAGQMLDYLKASYNELIYASFVFHPVDKAGRNTIEVYKKGERKKRVTMPTLRAPKTVVHQLAFLLNAIVACELIDAVIWLRVRYKIKPRVFIAPNAFLVFVGILFRSLRLTEHVVFWVWDYYPTPSKGLYKKLLFRMYWWLDRWCTRKADYVWYLNQRLLDARIDHGVRSDAAKQYVAPLGIKPLGAQALTTASGAIGFLGVLKKGQGLDLLFDSLEDLAAADPDIRVEILGSGPDESYFKQKVEENPEGRRVKFLGFVERDEDMRKAIASWRAAVALYVPSDDNVAAFTDPSKVHLYIGCGTPVIMTGVPEISEEISRNGAGIVVDYDREQFVQAVRRVMADNAAFKENCLKMAREYEYKHLYDQVFDRIFDSFKPAPENRS